MKSLSSLQAPPRSAEDQHTLLSSLEQLCKVFLRKPVFFTLLLCVTPSILTLLGIDFSSTKTTVATLTEEFGHLTTEHYFTLQLGAHTHALLEWSAVSIGLLTVVITLVHFNLTHDFTTPIIGIALFCSALMDAFHTLAALRMVTATADNTNFIPFTWALSRTFNATILSLGVFLCLYSHRSSLLKSRNTVMVICAIAGIICYSCIHGAATSPSLPQTQYPNQWITRPFDLLPLLIFGCASFGFYKLYKEYPSRLSAALFITLIPEIVLELHMAFGSSELFDHHFNIAHFLKIFSYLIPFMGLAAEYARAYQAEIIANQTLDTRNQALDEAVGALTSSNEQLERFAFICSHDLQEPVRMVQSFSNLLSLHLEDQLDEKGKKYLHFINDGADRARVMIRDVLLYSRLEQDTTPLEAVDLNELCNNLKQTLSVNLRETQGEFTWSDLPSVQGVPSQLHQLLLNLVSNGLKFNRHRVPTVSITVEEDSPYWRLKIQDNGIGIKSDYHEKVFRIFERLNKREDYSGTGIGLAICKKIVERHHGEIWIESHEQQGCVFIVRLAKIDPEHN